MKFLFISLILLFFGSFLSAQVATSNCSSVTVTNTPSYPTVYFSNTTSGNCQGDGNGNCCKIIFSGNPVRAKYWLEEYVLGVWTTVAGPTNSSSFGSLSHGTYRVKIQTPLIAQNVCNVDGLGNITKSVTYLYNTIGQFIGYWGTWDNAPFSGPNIYYTNNVIVGETTSADISYTFVDVPETGSELTYDFGETVVINTSSCTNYTHWWLAIFESGPVQNRYLANGWSFGTISSFNLTNFWGGVGNNFLPFHTYTVQFVTENSVCGNTPQWNNLDRTFFICPTGTGCKLGSYEEPAEIVISPNPANSIINFQNYFLESNVQDIVSIININGQTLRSSPLDSNELDVSGLSNGIYIVSIDREGKSIFKSKIIISH